MKPCARFSPHVVVKVRKLQSHLRLAKFLEDRKMIQCLGVDHGEAPNAELNSVPPRDANTENGK
jgi:hypothetical protein